MITVTDPCPNCKRGQQIRDKAGKLVGVQFICTGQCNAPTDFSQAFDIQSADSFVKKAIQRHKK